MIYTNRFINIISFFITCILFVMFTLALKVAPKTYDFDIPSSEDKSDNVTDNNAIEKENINSQIDLGSWYIEIPSINLKAPIAEGTSMEILNKYVGHFEDTSTVNGNIGLAAHNRGYENNFFQDLKYVKINDEINYFYNGVLNNYVVDKIEIIENTDWSYLEQDEDNKITLITCVENEPNYRRCVQGLLKEEV